MSSRVIDILESGNSDETSDMEIAKQVADALQKFYPHHPWLVGAQGHNIVIRHMAIADCVHVATGKSGFAAALPQSALRTPKEIVQASVRMGGQLLEAFKLPRGEWDGRDPICPGYDRTTPYKRQGWH